MKNENAAIAEWNDEACLKVNKYFVTSTGFHSIIVASHYVHLLCYYGRIGLLFQISDSDNCSIELLLHKCATQRCLIVVMQLRSQIKNPATKRDYYFNYSKFIIQHFTPSSAKALPASFSAFAKMQNRLRHQQRDDRSSM